MRPKLRRCKDCRYPHPELLRQDCAGLRTVGEGGEISVKIPEAERAGTAIRAKRLQDCEPIMVTDTALVRSFGSLAPLSQQGPKPSPTVALVELDPFTTDTMRKAFAECGIRTVDLGSEFASRVTREKFEGCALRLDDRAAPLLRAVRSSSSNHHMIVYGIGSEDLHVRPCSSYGINAILDFPVDGNAATRTARSTCALLLQELRRYVRIPLVIEVSVENTPISGFSREISGGGISLHLPTTLPEEKKVRLAFALPGKSLIRIQAAVVWKYGSQIGFQFEDSDPAREIVKSWIDAFLCLQ